ncbi:hypothetical protein UT300012_22560 [Paraclostridium bifermentans]
MSVGLLQVGCEGNRLKEIHLVVSNSREVKKIYSREVTDNFSAIKAIRFIENMFRRHNIHRCYSFGNRSKRVLRLNMIEEDYTGYFNKINNDLIDCKRIIAKKSGVPKEKWDSTTLDDLKAIHGLALKSNMDALDVVEDLIQICSNLVE